MSAVAFSEIAALPSVAYTERRSLPEVGGVYFAIIDSREIAYVGATWSFHQRWRAHNKARALLALGDLRIHYLPLGDDWYTEYVEQDVIEEFNPRLNHCPARWGWRPTPGVWLPVALLEVTRPTPPGP